MDLLIAPLIRPEILSLDRILEMELDPFESLKYLLEEIVILGIPKGIQFTEPKFYPKDCICYDFTVKHSILINGEVKTVDITFMLTISCGKVAVTTKTMFDKTTEIYKSFDEFGSIYDNYIDISLLVKEKITLF